MNERYIQVSEDGTCNVKCWVCVTDNTKGGKNYKQQRTLQTCDIIPRKPFKERKKLISRIIVVNGMNLMISSTYRTHWNQIMLKLIMFCSEVPCWWQVPTFLLTALAAVTRLAEGRIEWAKQLCTYQLGAHRCCMSHETQPTGKSNSPADCHSVPATR